MPTYTYACTACDHAFDVRQSFSDDPLTDCPECAEGGGRLRKVIHPVGISFKGSGFYKTDSRASSKSTSSSTDTKSESKSESKLESTSESKSESKSAPAAKSESSSSSAPKPAASPA